MKTCKFFGCENRPRVRGLCPTHYSADLKGTAPQKRDVSEMPKCDVPHCTEPADSRAEKSLCYEHYQAQYRGRNPYETVISSGRRRVKCWVESCPRQGRTKGLCSSHIKKAKEGKLEVPDSLGVVLNPVCTFEGCEKLQHSKKLCKGHYDQNLRGVKLTPLREWGGYSRGDIKCEMDRCKKEAISKGLCVNHYSKLGIYGITKERLKELFEVRKCYNPGCKNTKNLHIDHNHETGRVRGLLCTSCNKALGMLEEDRSRIVGLTGYLDEFDM